MPSLAELFFNLLFDEQPKPKMWILILSLVSFFTVKNPIELDICTGFIQIFKKQNK